MTKNATTTSKSARYDVLIADPYKTREGTEKTTWTRIGVARRVRCRPGCAMRRSALPWFWAAHRPH